MQNKIRLLIIVSILGLLSLSLIQGYLINNTYKLEKDAFITETRKSISRIDDLSPKLDTINDIWQEGFLSVLSDYQARIIKKKVILIHLRLIQRNLKKILRFQLREMILFINFPQNFINQKQKS
tara:strand:+ start:2374 stop:2745 length:372 start_codon:yes stop_codon:yes gene_type:complete